MDEHGNDSAEYLTALEFSRKYPDPVPPDKGEFSWRMFLKSLITRQLIREHAQYHGPCAARKFHERKVLHLLIRDAKACKPFPCRVLVTNGDLINRTLSHNTPP